MGSPDYVPKFLYYVHLVKVSQTVNDLKVICHREKPSIITVPDDIFHTRDLVVTVMMDPRAIFTSQRSGWDLDDLVLDVKLL